MLSNYQQSTREQRLLGLNMNEHRRESGCLTGGTGGVVLPRDKVGVLGCEICGKCILAAGSVTGCDSIGELYKMG